MRSRNRTGRINPCRLVLSVLILTNEVIRRSAADKRSFILECAQSRAVDLGHGGRNCGHRALVLSRSRPAETRWPAISWRIKEELIAQQSLRKQREREVYLLENDKEYIETIARDKLDMMKEGETIFRLDPAKAAKAGAKIAMIEQLETIDTSAISARLAELRRFL